MIILQNVNAQFLFLFNIKIFIYVFIKYVPLIIFVQNMAFGVHPKSTFNIDHWLEI